MDGGTQKRHGYHRLRVSRVVQETGDTKSFVLAVPAELADVFRYRSGQFCTFRVEVDGEEHYRSYSMSSAPETDTDLTVTVKRVPSGPVSNQLNDRVREDDVLEVSGPAGVFCARDGTHPVVAFCGGSGITPVLSITKSVLASSRRRVTLLYANRDRQSVIFDEELRRLRRRHPDRFDVRYHFDSDGGFLDASLITALAEENADADFYICGPTPFMDLVEDTLGWLGVGADHVLVERFGEVAPHAQSSESDGGDTPPESVTLILNGKKQTVAYQPGDTVLETARRGGLRPPFSCEAGNCATCMGIVRAGHAAMRVNNALTPEEVEEGWVLTCQALPQGPGTVTVEYEAF